MGQLWETVITLCMEVAVYHSRVFVIDVSYTSVSFFFEMPQNCRLLGNICFSLIF